MRLRTKVEEVFKNQKDGRVRLPALKTIPKFRLVTLVKTMNEVVSLIPTINLTETNRLMYAVAYAASEELGFKVPQTQPKKGKLQLPMWKMRLQQKIDGIRREEGELEEMKRGRMKNSEVQAKLTQKYNLADRTIQEVSEDLR